MVSEKTGAMAPKPRDLWILNDESREEECSETKRRRENHLLQQRRWLRHMLAALSALGASCRARSACM